MNQYYVYMIFSRIGRHASMRPWHEWPACLRRSIASFVIITMIKRSEQYFVGTGFNGEIGKRGDPVTIIRGYHRYDNYFRFAFIALISSLIRCAIFFSDHETDVAMNRDELFDIRRVCRT